MKKILLFFLATSFTFAQNYPQNKFDNPLKIDVFLSGTFGELRNNHFHSGLDIRTQKKIGIPVYAPADGFVSRIKVSTFGYGKALYISHPQGYTTVYGHLDSYNDNIGEFVKERQYSSKKNEIELFPKAGFLKVKKGEIIAFTGNSGGSGGPHLHYEFRDTKTEKIINPMHFGMDSIITDTKAPVLNSLLVYTLDEDAVANQSQIPIEISLSKQANGSYIASKVKAKGNIGFGINTHDISDFNYGKNGVYSISTFLNGSLLYTYKFDTFSFDESRYINALIDYERYILTKQRFQKLFYIKPYNLSIVKNNSKNGCIKVEPGDSFNYRIEISDFNNNKTIVNIPIDYAHETVKIFNKQPKTNLLIKSERDYIFERDNVTVEFSKDTFYEDFYLNLDVKDDVLYLHKDIVPLHKNINIIFDISNRSDIKSDKSFIGLKNKNKIEYFSTYKKNNKFYIKTRKFGEYTIFEDNIPPKIYNPSFRDGAELKSNDKLSFLVKDDLSGISKIEAHINGKWILLDYDYKTNKVVHSLKDGIATKGKNNIKIMAIDKIGNKTTFESNFYIK